MSKTIEYRLSRPQQRAAKALAQARDRAQAEFEEIIQAFEALATAYAATFGEERRVRFDQEGERVFLIVVPEEEAPDVILASDISPEEAPEGMPDVPAEMPEEEQIE